MAQFSDLPLQDVTSFKLDPPQQRTVRGLPFPLALSPPDSDRFPGVKDVCDWIIKNRSAIHSALGEHGAILFRKFPISCPGEFDQFVKAFGFRPVPYLGGAAPRNHVIGDVFTANEAPPDEVILFHNEMAYLPISPDYVFFYCETPPKSGGETPIVLSRIVYEEVKSKLPDFLKAVEDRKVVYSRVLPNFEDNKSTIGRSWQASFNVKTKSEAEEKLREQNATAEWLDDGSLRMTSEVTSAVRSDGRTGQKVWYNTIISSYRNWKDSRNRPEDSVRFADGEPMDPEVMHCLEEIMETNAANFLWETGDVLMIDNRLALHGRRTFVPPRRILAALCARA